MGAKEQAIASGLIGLSTGWLKGRSDFQDNQLKQQQIDEELAWKREQRQAERTRMQQDAEMRTSLASAARPAQIDTGYQVTDAAGSNAFTKDADAAAMMGDMVADQRPSLARATRVQETAYRDPRQAQAAQAQYNSAPATLDRMGLAAMPYDPAKGLGLQGQAATARKAMTEEQKKMQAEIDDRFNSEIASIAMSGPKWWEAAADALTKSGAPAFKGMKGKAELSEDGKTVTFKAILPDGTEKTASTFEASEKGAQDWAQSSARLDSKTKLSWLADRAKQLREEDKAKEKSGLTLAEIQARGDEDRKTIDYKRKNGDTGKESVGREERLRYTSLFQDAGRRQAEAQKSYNTLIKERAYANAKPDSPQAQELESLRDAIKQYGDERKTYQSMLAEGASKSAENPAGRVGLGATNSSERGMAEQTKGGMGADAASIRREIAAAQADIARAPDAESKRMLADHVANMERQLAGISGQSQGLSAMRQPARQAAGQPVKVATKAERDALPAGTQYIDPNGQVFVKK